MSQGRFLTVPSPGEVARPFEILLDEASTALPVGFLTSTGEVLVALDTDGTILIVAGATPHVFGGIHGLATAGAQVLTASGRALEGVTSVLSILEFTGRWVLYNNDATLVRVSGGECEVVGGCTFVPGPILGEITTIALGSVLASMSHPDILPSASFPNNEIEGNDYRIMSMEELAPIPTSKIVVYAVETNREEFGRILSSPDMLRTHEVFVGWTSWADIEPLGVTKASGLEPLRQCPGLPACGIAAVGGGTNDIAMIRWATFDVTMGGASEEMRAHTGHVTAAVDSDGAAAVMHAIMRCYGSAGR